MFGLTRTFFRSFGSVQYFNPAVFNTFNAIQNKTIQNDTVSPYQRHVDLLNIMETSLTADKIEYEMLNKKGKLVKKKKNKKKGKQISLRYRG